MRTHHVHTPPNRCLEPAKMNFKRSSTFMTEIRIWDRIHPFGLTPQQSPTPSYTKPSVTLWHWQADEQKDESEQEQHLFPTPVRLQKCAAPGAQMPWPPLQRQASAQKPRSHFAWFRRERGHAGLGPRVTLTAGDLRANKIKYFNIREPKKYGPLHVSACFIIWPIARLMRLLTK